MRDYTPHIHTRCIELITTITTTTNPGRIKVICMRIHQAITTILKKPTFRCLSNLTQLHTQTRVLHH
mgnify:CR=1 FL=1